MRMEEFLGDVQDNLRMIPLGSHAPLDLNLDGRWKINLCLKIIGIENEVMSTNESLMPLDYVWHQWM